MSKDPVKNATISIPSSLLDAAKRKAEANHMSLSAFITSLIRKRFKNAEGV